MASQRPPRPGLDDRDLDLAARQLVERGGGQQLELGHALAVASVRSTFAAAAAARWIAAPKLGPERSASPIRIRSAKRRQVRRQVRARAHAVRLQQRRREAHRRGLAVGADDVDGAEALLRRAEHGQQPPHALQPEAHPEQLEREQVLLGRGRDPRAHESSSSSRLSCSSLSRSAWTTCSGALATKPWLASLPSARAISLRSVACALGGAALLGLEVDGVGREHRDVAAGHADGRHRLVAVRGELEAREPGDVLGHALVALGLEPRRDARAGRRADAVAPLAQRLRGLDRPLDLGLDLLVAQRRIGLRASGGPSAGPRAGQVATRSPR